MDSLQKQNQEKVDKIVGLFFSLPEEYRAKVRGKILENKDGNNIMEIST